MAELPPANTRRWVARRKAAVVAAVQNGKITLEEACRRYELSEEEFRSWQRTYQSHGVPVCAPLASSNTAPRPRRDPANRAADSRSRLNALDFLRISS